MRSARLLTVLLLVGSLGGWAWGKSTAIPGPGPNDDRLAPLIQIIRQAENPSAAIEAYAKGQAIDRDSVGLKSAYVAKMVEFGLPEMADTQAQDLIQRDPNNGLAWAVAAYMSAKRDETATALADMSIAVRRLPDDLFVMRTAGQLLAWYDVRADKSKIPEDVKSAAESIRKQIGSRPAFADAYTKATEVYKQQPQRYDDQDNQPAGPSTQPSVEAAPQPAPSEPGAASSYPAQPPVTYDDSPVYGGGGYYAPEGYAYVPYPRYIQPYTDPYVYAPYAPYSSWYSPWWPNTYCGFNWWWPTFTSVVFVNNDHFFHHRNYCVDKDVARWHHNKKDGHPQGKDRWTDGRWNRDRSGGQAKGDRLVADRRGQDTQVRPERDGAGRSGVNSDRALIRPVRDVENTPTAQRDRGNGNRPEAAQAARPNRDRADAAARERGTNATNRPEAKDRRDAVAATPARERAARPEAADNRRNDVTRAAPPVARRDATPRNEAAPRNSTAARNATPRAENPGRQAAPAPRRADPAPSASSAPRLSTPSRGSSGSQLRSSTPRPSTPPARNFSAPSGRSASPGRSGINASPRLAPSGGGSAMRSGGSSMRGGSGAAMRGGGGSSAGGGAARGGGGGRGR